MHLEAVGARGPETGEPVRALGEALVVQQRQALAHQAAQGAEFLDLVLRIRALCDRVLWGARTHVAERTELLQHVRRQGGRG
jgi:hypothetical protein